MRPLALIAIVALVAAPASAQRRRAVLPSAPLSIEFVDVGNDDGSLTSTARDAWLDLGRISKHDPHIRGTHVRRRLGIRVVRPGAFASGSARITARLASWDGRANFRLDGQTLTVAPLLVETHALVGAVVTHRLDIDVPESSAAGPLATSIVWEVLTN